MIKFMSLEFLGLSHRIPGKVKNNVYSFKISALVPETFKTDSVQSSSNYLHKLFTKNLLTAR